jgi:hypothetical protein
MFVAGLDSWAVCVQTDGATPPFASLLGRVWSSKPSDTLPVSIHTVRSVSCNLRQRVPHLLGM